MQHPSIYILILSSSANTMIRGRSRESRYYLRSVSAKNKSLQSHLHSSPTAKTNVTQGQQVGDQREGITYPVNGFKLNQLVGMKNEEMGKFKRNSAKFTNKSIEQLFEETLHLKKQNHELMEEIAKLKGKFEAKSRCNSVRGKELDLEFEKELYWGSSKTHLISGIKHQYQKLQKQYEDQSKQLNELKKALLQAKVPQLQVQVQVLEQENKKLTEKLSRMMKNSGVGHGKSKNGPQVLLTELQEKISKTEKAISEINNQLESCTEQLRQKQTKNIFLEKLLIQKDNALYYANRKIKKMEKQIADIKSQKNELREIQKGLEDQHEGERRALLKEHERAKHEIKEEMKKQIDQLRYRIQLLLEDKKEMESTFTRLKMTTGSRINRVKSMASKNGFDDKKSIISIKEGNLTKNESFSGHQQSRMLNNKIEDNNMQEQDTSLQPDIESEASQKSPKSRTMITADQKHSNNAKRLRKVEFSQVLEIGELIKYKMIGAGLTADEMKKLFDRPKQPKYLSPEADSWSIQHITMKETIAVLQGTMFGLDSKMAYLLARYLIEDCNEEYVYCDEINEHKREVVKSILKNLVGEYSLRDQDIENEFTEFKTKYLGNLELALKTYYPNGKVCKKKLVEVIENMEAQLSERAIDWLVARVVEKSASLAELEYSELQNL